MGLLDGLLKTQGDPMKAANADVLASYESRVKKINDLEDEIEKLSDDELRQEVFLPTRMADLSFLTCPRSVGYIVGILLFVICGL